MIWWYETIVHNEASKFYMGYNISYVDKIYQQGMCSGYQHSNWLVFLNEGVRLI